MKYTCISAANIEPARANSASTHACELIRDLLVEQDCDAQVTILPLIDYELRSCRMCGQCLASGFCARDEAFNAVYRAMIAADAVFLVCPHYAPLPSKVMVLMEKLEEIAFLNYCADQNCHLPLYHKPVGIVAHGGRIEDAAALAYYQTALLDPLAMDLESVQMRVTGAGEGWPKGVVFGIRTIAMRPGSIFVDITQDWDAVRLRLVPLVVNVVANLAA
jgi:multimeric flavodoxin WrbA